MTNTTRNNTAKAAALGRCGHEAYDRSRCSFINIRCPDVKRCRSYLKSQANEHQRHCYINQQVDRPSQQRPADVVNIG